MTLRERMDEAISRYALLSHPFYRAWTDGTLPRAALQRYAGQYYHHVLAFPTYVSAVHSRAGNDLAARKVLLENLIEEERGDRNHPALWLQFAAGIGATDAATQAAETGVRQLVDAFTELTRTDLAGGAAALYAYESQVPAVADAKIEGLRKHFGVTDEATLEFFTVHREVDKYHSASTAEIVERQARIPALAVRAAENAARALYTFLGTMMPSA
jgi:pyrroloquinoline-quinone synthase